MGLYDRDYMRREPEGKKTPEAVTVEERITLALTRLYGWGGRRWRWLLTGFILLLLGALFLPR